ncbi:MAG: long-chain fatty acid--CoA ligase, partial [Rhizobacter sp.]|nr:long-chain fatty acid--CoA ligase [Rhizobacter sp.]
QLKDAIVCGDRIKTRAALLDQAARAASGLDALGIVEGDVVALLLRNDFAFLEATEAANLLGAYGVPINWHLKPDEVRFIVDDCEPKILIAHADLYRDCQAALPADLRVLIVPSGPEALLDFKVDAQAAMPDEGAVVWDDWCAGFAPWSQPARPPRATMMYTSGTTGRPKGVRRFAATPEQVAGRAAQFRDTYGVSPNMRAMITGPLYHASPNGFARHALRTADLLLLQSRFDAEKTLADIEAYGITNAVMVPTMFVRFFKLPDAVRLKYDMHSLQWVTHTAAPCPAEVKRSLIQWWGPVIHEVYGGTEVGLPIACSSEEWLSHPGTVGHPTGGTRIAIYDDAGHTVGEGVPGEIYMRCSTYADFTYHKQEDKRKGVERDGLISVGDVGYMKDGYLYLCDRKSDMVISGGVNIYPAEVEKVLLECPAVRDCAVFGVPDDDLGEVLLAAIELTPGCSLTEEEAKRFMAERMARYKVPRKVEFHASLPREDSGKIFKRRLRDVHWQTLGRQI